MKNNITHSNPQLYQGGEKGTECERPIWIRLPREGRRCPHTNLTRASLNKLILGDEPKVESIALKEEGTARGVRLIRLSSLLGYLEQIAVGEEGQP